jgi:hypothetical protein
MRNGTNLALLGLATLALAACGGSADAGTQSVAEARAQATEQTASAESGAAEHSDRAEVDHAAMSVDPAKLVVYKTETCGCCGKWVDHMKQAGFDVEVHDMSQQQLTGVKTEKGITHELASCHTAEIGGYVVEGHVPAEDLKRLLAEKPEGVAGIAVPGMPVGSPGMEDPSRPADEYDVVTFTSSGETEVFASH